MAKELVSLYRPTPEKSISLYILLPATVINSM